MASAKVFSAAGHVIFLCGSVGLKGVLVLAGNALLFIAVVMEGEDQHDDDHKMNTSIAWP